MQGLTLAVATILAGSVLSADASAGGPSAAGPLRPVGDRATTLLARGRGESTTFCELVTRLDTSDLIIYITVDPFWEGPFPSTLRFVTESGGRRYVRISLTARDTNTKLIPWLGHELQHAVEVAEHADITSPESLAKYFAVYETSVSHGAYESAAAVSVQGRIAVELGRRPPLAGQRY